MSAGAGRDLYEFLQDAELQHYHDALRNDLKVTSSRPHCRRILTLMTSSSSFCAVVHLCWWTDSLEIKVSLCGYYADL